MVQRDPLFEQQLQLCLVEQARLRDGQADRAAHPRREFHAALIANRFCHFINRRIRSAQPAKTVADPDPPETTSPITWAACMSQLIRQN
jgi:hypothetical protein